MQVRYQAAPHTEDGNYSLARYGLEASEHLVPGSSKWHGARLPIGAGAPNSEGQLRL